MDKSHLVLLLVIKPVDLHETKWLAQIYIFVFIKTLRDVWWSSSDRSSSV